jgi:hypothetical protein
MEPFVQSTQMIEVMPEHLQAVTVPEFTMVRAILLQQTKKQVSVYELMKDRQTDRQTDRHTHTHTHSLPHSYRRVSSFYSSHYSLFCAAVTLVCHSSYHSSIISLSC